MTPGRPAVLVSAEDASRLGIESGARVVLGNDRGEVTLHAEVGARVRPGVLVVESLWPSEAFEGGIGINALTSADFVAPAGGAAFHDTSVWMEPLLGPS